VSSEALAIVAEIRPLGVLIATGFVGTLLAVLWWMLNPPALIPAAAAKARQSLFAVKKILVPTIGLPYAERGVELACRLGDDQHAQILLAYVLEVPRTLPLSVPLPEAEQRAAEALERGASIVALHDIPVTKIVQRARLAGEEIAKIAKAHDVDMIVLGLRSEEEGLRGATLGKTSDSILRNAPCEVVINKLPKSWT